MPRKVEREPYSGPVVQIPQDNVPATPLSPAQYSKKDREEKVSRAGHRNLHSSGFSLAGMWSNKYILGTTTKFRKDDFIYKPVESINNVNSHYKQIHQNHYH